jgi:hypothetical protein
MSTSIWRGHRDNPQYRFDDEPEPEPSFRADDMRRQRSSAGGSPIGGSSGNGLHPSQERLRFLLRFAALAPSSFNTQPWAFRLMGDGVDVYADYSRRLPVVDPDDRELMMSIGAAIMNFRVAAARHGMDLTVSYTTGRDGRKPVAHISVQQTGEPNGELSALFPALRRRQMNRGWMWLRQQSPAAAAGADSSPLAVPSGVCAVIDQFPGILQLVTAQQSRPGLLIDFAASRGAWPGAAVQAVAQSPSAGGRMQLAEGVVVAGPWPVLRPASSSARGAAGRGRGHGASALVLVTSEDDRIALIQAGEALERLLLVLTLSGLHYSFFSHPIELDDLHARMLPASAALPKVLLSISSAPVAVTGEQDLRKGDVGA